MKREVSPLVWGILLIAAGVLFLLQNLGLLGDLVGLVFGAGFAVGGVAFLYVYTQQRSRWWALIPGFCLLGIGATIVISELFPTLGGIVGGPLILGFFSIAFWAVYLHDRNLWWAIIPAGTLLSLAIVAGLGEQSVLGIDVGGLFLLGLGLTFALVAVVPTAHGRMHWAAIPAIVLILLGAFVMARTPSLWTLIGPAALILVGAALLFRAVLKRPRE